MHLLDIIIAVLAVIFIFIGLKRGLIGEVIRFTAMIAGCVIAFMYHHDMALHSPIKNIPVQLQIKLTISFIVIYLLCAVAIICVGWVIKKIVHLTPLGLIDRIVGAVIGFLKVLLIAYVICLSISSLPVKQIKRDFNKSVVYRTFNYLPKGLSLKSLLKKRDYLRNISRKEPAPQITTLQKKIDRFKTVVDSAKEAHTADSNKKELP